jgi:simple sugar transport system permease protein
MGAGAGLALIHAFFSIHLRADQIVSGTAINFLALGITGYFFVDVYGEEGTPDGIPRIPDVNLPLDKIPGGLGEFLDDVFGSLNLMIWLSFLLLFVSYIVMFKMPIGLRIRSVGEHPRAADTVGISVYGIRYLAVIISGILAAPTSRSASWARSTRT